MSERLDYLLENQLFTRLRILLADFLELKNRQPTSGKSGVLAYKTANANQWDLTEAIASPATNYGYSATFILEFTGDGSQNYPIVNPFADLMFSSSIDPTPRRATYRANGFLMWDDGTNSVTVNYYLRFDKNTVGLPLKTRWSISFSYYGSMTYYIKGYTLGTSRGSLLVARTA